MRDLPTDLQYVLSWSVENNDQRPTPSLDLGHKTYGKSNMRAWLETTTRHGVLDEHIKQFEKKN